MKSIICTLTISLALVFYLQVNGQIQRNDCVRGKAEPIVRKSIFPKTKFQLQADSLTAIETVDFDNGDRLTIRNWGCEYYCLTFQFETAHFQKDTSDLSFWYKSASKLMTEILKGLDAPVELKKGIASLDDYSKNHYSNLKLGKEIRFGIREPREFVTVDRIQKISDKKFLITLTFVVPL